VKRYLILFAAIVMQMCLGAMYSWSVFVQPLKAYTGMLQSSIQIPFSIFYFAFPATMIFSGSLLPKLGPRRCAVTGGLMFGGGWLLASLGGFHFGLTVAGIGLLAGIGVGFAYIVPIATLIQWFPRHKGLVTGIAVAGFGGGAALVSQTAGFLMSTRGLTPFESFALLGGVFLVLVTASGFTMENPPGTSFGHQALLPLDSVVRQKIFWILYVAMFTGLAAGFAVNANLKELYAGATTQSGVAAVSVFALANALGRVSWGIIFDRIQAAGAIQLNLACQAATLLSAPWVLQSTAGLILFSFLAGFNYGGVLVVYVSTAARTWGSTRVGQVYGWLFSANIPAALSPIVAGLAYDRLGTFTMPLIGIALFLVASTVWVGRSRSLVNGSRPALSPSSA